MTEVVYIRPLRNAAKSPTYTCGIGINYAALCVEYRESVGQKIPREREKLVYEELKAYTQKIPRSF